MFTLDIKIRTTALKHHKTKNVESRTGSRVNQIITFKNPQLNTKTR